jgi:hypothetical protein
MRSGDGNGGKQGNYKRAPSAIEEYSHHSLKVMLRSLSGRANTAMWCGTLLAPISIGTTQPRISEFWLHRRQLGSYNLLSIAKPPESAAD